MKLLKSTNTLLVSLSLALGGTGGAAEHAKMSGKVTACEKDWAQGAACSDLTELTLAKAASEKSQDAHVKQHAEKMISDHTKTSEELKAWAMANGVELKKDLPPDKKAAVEEIASKSGAEFDQAYMHHEVAGHRMAVAHFINGAEFNKDMQLQQFAQKNLPTIQAHLAEVEKMGGDTKNTAAMPGHHSKAGVSGNSTTASPTQGEVKAQ